MLKAASARGPLSAETVPLTAALGRVSALRLKSPQALPVLDNSSMDGYAVVAAATRGASTASPARLVLRGTSVAGARPAALRRPGGAWEIMTGAPLPKGYDAVVRVEDTRFEGGDVLVAVPAEPGDYVRRAGEDFRKGETLVEAGGLLDERALLVLASLGIAKVGVRRRPQAAVLGTGGELVDYRRRPRPAQVRNATGPYLAAALPRFGAEARDYGAVGDEVRDFEKAMEAVLAAKPDLVVTTGAVSMGTLDYVEPAVRRLGGQILFHKTAVRPGRPLLLASFKNGPLFFGLPGNPASTLAGLRFFVAPALRRLLGRPEERFPLLPLSAEIKKPEGLRCFFKARAVWGAEGPCLEVLPGQASFQMKPFLAANAWAVLPEALDRLAAGTLVEAAPFFDGGLELA